MNKLIILAIIGLVAQLIDGSLGMAYGVTSTSLLLMFGISPAVASASIHMAEVITTAASGISHIRFGNVDKKIVYRLIIPGSIGAFLGACFLSAIPGEVIKPFISIFLLILGIFVIYRFLFKWNKSLSKKKWTKKRFIPLGFIAGFFDATGGGGWGPITTPILLTDNQMEPRKVISSVDTSEFAIAISSTVGFLLTLGWSTIHLPWVLGLMIGGIIAAPIAAWLVKVMPTNLLGTLVGGIIIMTNLRTLLLAINLPSIVNLYIYSILGMLWLTAICFVLWKLKKEKGLSGK
ncbi:sulfite exporter TauE/SafE family protein [Caldibacillus lycopersici]|uniref:Probable membrane transporter protein n=1 Tax=Perspicuibacillus lycopersici TaxID=1325689 RepID=A0AAE3IX65_9BACI|nr:sulfite exporter TauE/SafE family protein [Perspicuibacillus lycopersici]MCU9614549.1 sulfite exporter TauE/SafE family protein [Perspicuibacillus lycopersici]